MRRLTIEWSPEDTPEALQARYRNEKQVDVRTRLQALWLLRSGRSMGEARDVVGVHYRSVQRWVSWYRRGGVTEVCSHHGGGHGKPSWLSPEQESQVAAQACTGAFTTAEDARRWISEQFEITYSPKGIYGLLHRVRLRLKVPRPIHVQADLKAQEEWKKGDVLQPSVQLG